MATVESAPTQANGDRRADIENWLDDKSRAWEYDAEFKLTSLYREKSLHNQARLGETTDLVVMEEYPTRWPAGTSAPPWC